MDSLLVFLETYGYWLLIAVGFAEYSGVPIASVPVLVAGGALASSGGLSLPVVAASAAIGGLAADASWYGLARWKGQGLVGVACGLSSNPRACVVGVERRIGRVGTKYILSAKFLPGAGNLIAPAAGYAGVPIGRFLALDAVALSLWGLVYSGLGWVFSNQISVVIEAATGYSRWVVGLSATLIGMFLVWRVQKARTHHRVHGGAQVAEATPDALAASAL